MKSALFFFVSGRMKTSSLSTEWTLNSGISFGMSSFASSVGLRMMLRYQSLIRERFCKVRITFPSTLSAIANKPRTVVHFSLGTCHQERMNTPVPQKVASAFRPASSRER